MLAALLTSLPVAARAASAGPLPAADSWTPPPGALPDAPSALYVVRAPVGTWPGDTSTVTNERGDFTVFAQDRRIVVDVRGDADTNLMFGVPDGPALQPGRFTYAEDDEATISFSHQSNGCGDGSGWVDVTRADFADGDLAHLELTFEHSCSFNGGPGVTHGALVWDASAPLGSPNPVAIPDDLWTPGPGLLPADANAAYIESPITVIDGLTATGTGVTGYDDTLDPDDQWGDAWRFGVGSGNASVGGTIQAGRHDDALQVGLYEGIFATNVNGVTGGLTLSYGSNALPSCPSWFAVDELSRSNGHIDHIAFRFEHDCTPGGTVTRGAVRWTAKPTITSITPNHGISRGGTEVQVEGIDLVDVSQVTVGGVDAPIIRSSWGSFLGFRTPTVPVGSHEIRITAAGGEAIGTGETGFTATPDTPSAPADVTVTPGPAQAIVSWLPPADLGAGTITGIRLDLYRWSNQDDAPPERTMTVGPDDTTALWGELWPGYTYRFAVTYVSSLGPATRGTAGTPTTASPTPTSCPSTGCRRSSPSSTSTSPAEPRRRPSATPPSPRSARARSSPPPTSPPCATDPSGAGCARR
ncbi:IPT/TIG domain-containing protein [Aquihabitans daechungensis]|uniref:IPT/TIG domain-containing protein n=1 Tax=Aquihabitans daechungensis TaxID=1052257 RepID=UPI003BA12E42